MTTNAETQANEHVKRRILRLQQVREQSKNIAKKIRSRVNEEKNKIVANINASKQRELEDYKKTNINQLQSNFESSIANIGSGHASAVFEDIVNKEWSAQKELNRQKALERGTQAATLLRKQQLGKRIVKHIPRKHNLRLQRALSPVNEKKTPTSPAREQFYEENGNSDNQCANIDTRTEINSNIAGELPESFDRIETNKTDNTIVDDERLHKDLSQHRLNSRISVAANAAAELDYGIDSNYPQSSIPIQNEQINGNSEIGTESNSFENQTRHCINNSGTINREILPQSHNAMPKNKVFTTVISDHIKNRKMEFSKPIVKEAVPCTDEECSNDNDSIRQLIQHTRYAPCTKISEPSPIIPILPANYRKYQNNELGKKYDKEASELQGPNEDWYLSLKSPPRSPSGTVCQCPTSCSKNKLNCARKKTSAENKQCSPLNNKNTRYVTGRHFVKCRPEKLVTPNKSESNKLLDGVKNVSSPNKKSTNSRQKMVRLYDHSNKFEKVAAIDSRILVEKIPKIGKSAYELAAEENNESDKAAAKFEEYHKREAQRIRGLKAMEQVKKEREKQILLQELDRFMKEKHLYERKLPDTVYKDDHRLKQDEKKQQQKSEKVFGNIVKQKKNHRHGHPKSAQPFRHRDNVQIEDIKKVSTILSSSTDSIEDCRSEHNRADKYSQTSVVNVANSGVSSKRYDNLDEIPTRDSDSVSIQSVLPEKRSTERNMQTMSVDRVLNLVEKQRDQLLREVARMGFPKNKLKTTKKTSHSHSKLAGRKDSSSTTDEQVSEVAEKTKFKKQIISSPKSKSSLTKCDDVLKKSLGNTENEHQQSQVSSTGSSISFQGLQILIEVKKGSKTDKKETTVKSSENIQTIETRRENEDSSTEVSIKTSKVTAQKEVIIGKDQNISSLKFDSSTSTSYMSPPEKFTSRAIETLFGRRIPLVSSETQTDIPGIRSDLQGLRNTDSSKSVENERAVRTTGRNDRSVSNNKVNEKTICESTTYGESFQTKTITNKNVTNKGVQASIVTQLASEKLYRVLKASNGNHVGNLDPRIKNYIGQLLELSKNGVNKLDVDVSDVPTPTSSIINTTSNVDQLPPQAAFNEKVEKLKQFIDENYSLLEQIERQNKFHRNYGKTKQTAPQAIGQLSASEVSSSDTEDQRRVHRNKTIKKCSKKNHQNTSLNNIGVSKKGKIFIRKNKKTSMNSKGDYKSTIISNSSSLSPSVEKLDILSNSESSPARIKMSGDCRAQVNDRMDQMKNMGTNNDRLTSDGNDKIGRQTSESTTQKIDTHKESIVSSSEEHLRRIEKYKKLSAECSQRITTLSGMLEQVRKEKQSTLSVSSSSSAECSHTEFQKLSPTDKKTNNFTYVPILGDIPKPGMDDHRQKSFKTVTGVHCTQENTEKNTNQYIDLDLEEFDSPDRHPKPPTALTRNSIMRNFNIDMVIPHELSTIIEVDTPITARNLTLQSRIIDTSSSSSCSIQSSECIDEKINMDSKNFPGSVKTKITTPNRPNDEITTTNRDTLSLSDESQGNKSITTEVLPFISFKDFVGHELNNIVNEQLMESTLKSNIEESPLKQRVNITSESEETLPDIIPEMIKRNLLPKSLNNNSSGNGSVEDTSSTSLSCSVPRIELPQKKTPTEYKKHSPKKFSNLKNKDVKNIPSISGVDILDTSSNSNSSNQSISEFEKALKDMGIGWAISTLRKTKETMDLSSTSSSIHKNSVHRNSADAKTLLEEFANITGTSVGLTTLLAEIDTPEDLFAPKGNANISNTSLNKELESLLKRIQDIKRTTTTQTSSLKKRRSVSEEKVSDCNIKSKGGHPLKGRNPNLKVNLFSEEASVSGLQASKDKTHHRTSTPVRFSKSTSTNSSDSNNVHNSNGLFGIESDLSSVKNLSSSDKNASHGDKTSLDVPNLSLKFGKLFDSANE